MRDDQRNAVPKVEEGQSNQTLKFFFTPVDGPRPSEESPHAKATTRMPEIIKALEGRFGDDVELAPEYAGEQTVYVARERLLDVCRFLKEDFQFVYFVDCGGIDLFTDDNRFEVYYGLISFERQKRIRLKVRVSEDDPVVPSLVSIYPAANWNERETYDMLGIRFEGHPDLRRMFMPEDFEYFPQRKEFPQLGVPGSLPLPAQVPEGELTMDPFASAHGHRPPRSYQEPERKNNEEQ